MSRGRKIGLVGLGCILIIASIYPVLVAFAKHREAAISNRDGGAISRIRSGQSDLRRSHPTNSATYEVPKRISILMGVEAGEISPEDAWSSAEELDMPSHERDSMFQNILEKIAEDSGPVAALEFLNARVGPGALRYRLLHGVFSTAALDIDQAAAALGMLEFPDEEMSMALEAIAASYVIHDLEAFDSSAIFAKLPPEAIPSLAQSVFDSWQRGLSSPATDVYGDALKMLHDAEALTSDDATRKSAEDGIISSLSTSHPNEAWRLITENEYYSSILSDSTRNGIVSRLIQENPTDGFSKIFAYNGEDRSQMIEHGVAQLALTDARKLETLLDEQPAFTADENRDAVAVGMIRFASAVSDREAGERWLSEIDDEKQRERGSLILSRIGN